MNFNIYSALVSHVVPSRGSTKAVQTKDRAPSLDFPTPPPAITETNGYSEQAPDEYLSLKVNSLYPTFTFIPLSASFVCHSPFTPLSLNPFTSAGVCRC